MPRRAHVRSSSLVKLATCNSQAATCLAQSTGFIAVPLLAQVVRLQWPGPDATGHGLRRAARAAQHCVDEEPGGGHPESRSPGAAYLKPGRGHQPSAGRAAGA
eukprot:358866-Pelagomonas_calceolata.AAC.3